jgi:hypothetical protein
MTRADKAWGPRDIADHLIAMDIAELAIVLEGASLSLKQWSPP